jgi:hypothetical protein
MTGRSQAGRQPRGPGKRDYRAPTLTQRGRIRKVIAGFKPVVTDGRRTNNV